MIALPYSARCRIEPTDAIDVDVDGWDGEVQLVARDSDGNVITVYLSPKRARKLAKAIKLAATTGGSLS